MFCFLPYSQNFAYSQNIKHCSNGVSRWNQITKLAPIKGLNFDSIENKGSISLTSTINPKIRYVLVNNNGNIFVRTPRGNANVQVCRRSGNKLVVTASVLGIRQTVMVETKGRGGIIHANGEQIPVSVN